jgi:hypothetical protein
MDWSGREPVAERAGQGGETLLPCNLSPRAAGVWASICPGIATRVDARSICFLGAGPTCPTCPTKIRKRERKTSLFLPNFLDAIRPRPKRRASTSLSKADTVGRLDATRWPKGAVLVRQRRGSEGEVGTRRRFHLRVYQERRRAMKPSAAATLFANIAISEGLTAPEAGAASWGVGVYPGCDSAAGFAAGGSSTCALSVCSE